MQEQERWALMPSRRTYAFTAWGYVLRACLPTVVSQGFLMGAIESSSQSCYCCEDQSRQSHDTTAVLRVLIS